MSSLLTVALPRVRYATLGVNGETRQSARLERSEAKSRAGFRRGAEIARGRAVVAGGVAGVEAFGR